MRATRLKCHGEYAVYHLISRTVAGAKLLGEEEKEVLRCQIRKMAAFSGVEVLTYCILSNHFHLLVRVPPRERLSDQELVNRVRGLYGRDEAQVLENNLLSSARADEVRKGLLKRMNDISFFMKELKMRFSIYYNKTHNRFGTVWAERFKSLLVESSGAFGAGNAVLTVAAYIDLNPVRAGLCRDPKDYRFCGYGEAVAGMAEAKFGLCQIINRKDMEAVLREYRVVLFGAGVRSDRSKEGGIDWEASREVLENRGKLPMDVLLRQRIRYFSDGLAFGSTMFIRKIRERISLAARRGGEGSALPVSDGEALSFARRARQHRKKGEMLKNRS